MLNWIAIWTGSYLFNLGGPLQNDNPAQRDVPVSNDVVDSAKLPVFWGDPELQGLHVGLFIALAMLLVFWVLLNRTTLGYEVRAVGFNPDAAEASGISVRRNYIVVMAVCGAFAGLAGTLDVLGWQFRIATNDIQINNLGFFGIAVALLGRNTAVGTFFSALLFGGLITGTSVRNLDPTVFEPALATNLTYMIQGLVVLLVSTDVLVVYLWRLRRRRRSSGPVSRGGRMTAKRVGWAGVALGFLAFFIAVPPIMVRSVVADRDRLPARRSTAGAQAIRGGREAARLGRVVAGLIGIARRLAATQSGESNLEEVVVWGALLASTLRYATPLTLGALGGLFSERSGVINIALEGMMLIGAFFGAWGADITGSWLLGIVIAVAAGAVFAALHALFAITFRADQIVSGTALNLLAIGITGYMYVAIYGDEGTPDDLPQVPDVNLPIKSVPLLGDVFGQLNLLVWVALALVVVTWVVVFRTAWGPAAALGGREPAGGRDCGPVGGPHALPRGHDLGRPGGDGRRVPLDRLRPHVLAEHDRRPRLHRAGGADLRALAARRRAGRDAAVRLRLRARAAAAGLLAVGRGALPGAAVRPDADRGHRPDRPLDPAARAGPTSTEVVISSSAAHVQSVGA